MYELISIRQRRWWPVRILSVAQRQFWFGNCGHDSISYQCVLPVYLRTQMNTRARKNKISSTSEGKLLHFKLFERIKNVS